MPGILSQAEIARLTRTPTRSVHSSTHSSSPSGSQHQLSSAAATSPAYQPPPTFYSLSGSTSTSNAGQMTDVLSPPPPAHYIKDKERSADASEESLKRLKKRSEIYDKSRHPVTASGSSSSLQPQQGRRRGSSVAALPDGLLFQSDPIYYSPPSSARSRPPSSGENAFSLSSPKLRATASGEDHNAAHNFGAFSPSKQWTFLDVDPMGVGSPPPTSYKSLSSAVSHSPRHSRESNVAPSSSAPAAGAALRSAPLTTIGSHVPHSGPGSTSTSSDDATSVVITSTSANGTFHGFSLASSSLRSSDSGYGSLSGHGSLKHPHGFRQYSSNSSTSSHKHQVCRNHRARKSDSSLSSNTSSLMFPPSLEPCSSYSPPVRSANLPAFATSPGPLSGTSSSVQATFSPTSPGPNSDQSNAHALHSPMSPGLVSIGNGNHDQLGSVTSPLSDANTAEGALSPSTPSNGLFDKQKRRRAYAMDHFTSYTASLPFARASAPDKPHSRHQGTGSESIQHNGINRGEAKHSAKAGHKQHPSVHSTRSVPDFRNLWRKAEPDGEHGDEIEEDEEAESTLNHDEEAPRLRKAGCRIMHGLKSILNPSTTPSTATLAKR